MDTIFFQNLLYFTLSVFVICVTAGFVICAAFVIFTLKSINRFFATLKQEGDKIVADIEEFRTSAKSNGMKFASMVLSVLSFLKHEKKSKSKNSK